MASKYPPDVRPKDKGRQPSPTQDKGVKLSMCIPEIAGASERDAHRRYRLCHNHKGLIPLQSLKETDLPSKHWQSKIVLDEVKDIAKRTVRVEVYKHRPQESDSQNPNLAEDPKETEPIWGSGFLFPGGYYKDKPCPCKDCVESGNPQIGFHSVYVMTARHVVFHDMEAHHANFLLFYEDMYKTKVKTIRGLGMAQHEECVCVNVDDCGRKVTAVVAKDCNSGDGGVRSGSRGDGCGTSADADRNGNVSNGEDGDGDEEEKEEEVILSWGNLAGEFDSAVDAIQKWRVNVREKMKDLRQNMESETEGSQSFNQTMTVIRLLECLSEGNALCARDLFKSLFVDLINKSGDYESLNIRVFEITLCLNNHFLELSEMSDRVIDQCKKLLAKARYLGDEKLYNHVFRLRQMANFARSYMNITVGDPVNLGVDGFAWLIISCFGKIHSMIQKIPTALALDNQWRIEDNTTSSDVRISIDKTQHRMISRVINRFSDTLRSFVCNDVLLFFSSITPFFFDGNQPEVQALQEANAQLWHRRGGEGGGVLITVFSTAFQFLNHFLNDVCQKHLADRQFLAILHRENLDDFAKRHYIRETASSGNITSYKTDRILVKSATHDPELIKFFKDMSFEPPDMPFTFIVSHPHACYKHIGFGDAQVTIDKDLGSCVVKLKAHSKVRLSKKLKGSHPSGHGWLFRAHTV